MTDELDPRLIEEPYPLQKHLNMRMTAWRKDYARIEIPLTHQLMNRQGLPHGGIHATLLDSAMGYAGCYTGDPDRQQMALTLSMTVNYLAQANGEILITEGWRTGGGRKTYFAEGRVTDHTGTVIATSTGVFRYRSGG
ncbi:PaaI family thioesterase [Roseovarius sp. ZX-A-9]|uniref:PaaI family thioesterase n=1 Tax=Roseovarius sp. ZX-A-9 TaxID=3014783 RepID=UPI002330949E|nr:PaaI family thioesterase [Roseovarius sp. ZX-A-9]